MSRGQTGKLYRTFTKGLITEAGFLTYPEDASTDELNTVISVKGNRKRRLGFGIEPNGVTAPIADYDQSAITSEFTWRAVNNKAGTNFFVIQVGKIVHFFSINAEPISTHKKSFTIDLEDYLSPAGTVDGLESTNCQFAAGKGFLFIVNPNIEPLVVEYLIDDDDVEVTRVVIQIRDFVGVSDGLANDVEPATLSKEHYYNLKNQGWIAPGLT